MEKINKTAANTAESEEKRTNNNGKKLRERILNEEEQKDISNEDGHHFDRHFEREDPEEKAIPLKSENKEDETIPKMNADPK